MFRKESKEKFSLRKYKNGRTDSKLIGAISILGLAMFAGGGTAFANVTSGDQSEAVIINDIEKVPSSAKQPLQMIEIPVRKSQWMQL